MPEWQLRSSGSLEDLSLLSLESTQLSQSRSKLLKPLPLEGPRSATVVEGPRSATVVEGLGPAVVVEEPEPATLYEGPGSAPLEATPAMLFEEVLILSWT